jgi:hypothetical protein
VIADAAIGLLHKLAERLGLRASARWPPSRTSPRRPHGDRAALPRAITLVESTRPDHREQAQQLLLELMPEAGSAMHVGITGVPGVGKSTTIEALGMYLIEQGHRVAVLAVDPSSTRTGGSILGDKTRMASSRCIPTPTSGRRRPRAPSAASRRPPARPSCCSRRPAST